MAAQLIEATAGAAGALVSTWALYPLDTLKAELATDKAKDTKLSYFDSRLYEGIFNGIGAKSVQTLASSFVFFYAYENLKLLVAGSPKSAKKLSAATNIAIATLAGCVNVLVTMPLDTIATRKQCAGKKSNAAAANGDASLPHTDDALYRGVVISLLLSINPGVNYAAFEQLKRRHQESVRVKLGRPAGRALPQLSAKAAFVLGAAAKCIATLTTYPAIRTKVLLQGPGGDRYKGANDLERAADALCQVLRLEGMPGLYKGAQPQLLKTVLGAALMLMLKEKISAVQRAALRRFT